jgi:hypothetical protein
MHTTTHDDAIGETSLDIARIYHRRIDLVLVVVVVVVA